MAGPRVFLRQKWTKYLGELRPIHDQYVAYTCPENAFYSQIIQKVTGPNDIYNSIDGISWYSAGTFPSSGYTISDTITNGKVRLVNSYSQFLPTNNTIWYSEDGISYQIANQETSSGVSLPLIWDGNRFITGIINGDLLVSEDGISWENNSTLNSLLPTKYNLGYNGTYYMVLGSGATGVKVAYSNNLSTWNLSPSGATGQITQAMPTINGRTYITGSYNIAQTGFTAGGGYYYTDDGINWSNLNIVSGSGYVSQVVWTLSTNGYVLLAGTTLTGTTGNRIFYSFDSGSTWTAASTPFSGSSQDSVRDIFFDGTKFLAFGEAPNDGCYSYDGITWTVFSGVTYGSNYARGLVFPQPYSYPSLAQCDIIPTRTPSISPTATPSGTPNVTPTPTVTKTPTMTQTATNTATPTNTQTSGLPSSTPTNTPTNTPSITASNTPTPSITATNTPTPSITPSSTPPTVCYCYWLFNETGSPANYSYTQCGGTFISDTLAGGAQIRICSEDLPAVDPGITSTPCGITCTLDSDCTGCT